MRIIIKQQYNKLGVLLYYYCIIIKLNENGSEPPINSGFLIGYNYNTFTMSGIFKSKGYCINGFNVGKWYGNYNPNKYFL